MSRFAHTTPADYVNMMFPKPTQLFKGKGVTDDSSLGKLLESSPTEFASLACPRSRISSPTRSCGKSANSSRTRTSFPNR